MTILYRDDLKSYDGLFHFYTLFPEFEDWEIQLNDYMIFSQVGDNENAEKIYNMIFNRYKGHFFRYEEASTIYNKLSLWLEELYTELSVINTFSDSESITSTTTTDKNYRTNNTNDENISGFLTNEDVSIVNDPKMFIEQKNITIKRSSILNRKIEDLRTMFRNKTDKLTYVNIMNKTNKKKEVENE